MTSRPACQTCPQLRPDALHGPGQGQAATASSGVAQGLTPRERDVLVLICRGLSNHQIAQTLFLSINTVKTNIRSCYRKIGAQSRSQAVIWGLAHEAAAGEQASPISTSSTA